MRRREFITFLGGAVVGWPLAARAQQGTRRIGVLMGFAESDPTAQAWIAAFRDALAKLGWTEGGNLRIELRWGAAVQIRSDVGKRAGRSAARRDLRSDHTCDRRACPRDTDNSDRIRLRCRSNRQRLHPKPCASRRQRHRVHVSRTYDRRQVGRAIEGDRSEHRARGGAVQPGNNPTAQILHAIHSSGCIIACVPQSMLLLADEVIE